MKANQVFAALATGVLLSVSVPALAAQPNGTFAQNNRAQDRDNDRNARQPRARGNDATPARPVAQRPVVQPRPAATPTPQRRFANERPRVAERTPPRPVARAPEPARPVFAEHAPRHRPVVHAPVVHRPVVHRPVIVERPVYVERPVVYERPYMVERPVYVDPPYPYYNDYNEPYYGEPVAEGPFDDTNLLGMIAGAVLGAVLGNQIGGEDNGPGAAAIGAILGGVLGGGM